MVTCGLQIAEPRFLPAVNYTPGGQTPSPRAIGVSLPGNWKTSKNLRTLPTRTRQQCEPRERKVRLAGNVNHRTPVIAATIRNEADDGSCPKTLVQELAKGIVSAAMCLTVVFGSGVMPAEAKRPEGVNKPELLPKEFTRVIDVAGFLSSGQEDRLSKDLERLENDTGFKLRVLAQNYPETPGLAIKSYWRVDDETVVLVADPSLSGNILNFNVGATVDLSVPRSFWSRLTGKYGNMFYWKEHGEDASIEAAVVAIDACLREPAGPRQCSEIKGPD